MSMSRKEHSEHSPRHRNDHVQPDSSKAMPATWYSSTPQLGQDHFRRSSNDRDPTIQRDSGNHRERHHHRHKRRHTHPKADAAKRKQPGNATTPWASNEQLESHNLWDSSPVKDKMSESEHRLERLEDFYVLDSLSSKVTRESIPQSGSREHVYKQILPKREITRPSLVIPKPSNSLRNSAHFGRDDSERTTGSIQGVPEFSPKRFPKKVTTREQHSISQYSSHESSSRYRKLESREDCGSDETQDREKSNLEADEKMSSQDVIASSTNIHTPQEQGEFQESINITHDDELCSSTCATWHSRLSSLLSHHRPAPVDMAEVSERLHDSFRRIPHEQNESEKKWFERPASEKDKPVVEEPYVMHMVFFDRDETADEHSERAGSNCLCSIDEMDDLEAERANLTTHSSKLTTSVDDLPTGMGESIGRKEHVRVHSPALTPETFVSHSQSNGLSAIKESSGYV